MEQAGIRLRQVDSAELVAAAIELFREYAGAIGTDLGYQGFDAEMASLPGPYVPPYGALIIATAGPITAGCVGLRQLGRRTGEIKRLYVRPAYRSRGLGRRMIEMAMQASREAGFTRLRLDTLPDMASAQALYRRMGFVEIAAYNDVHLPGTRFFESRLST